MAYDPAAQASVSARRYRAHGSWHMMVRFMTCQAGHEGTRWRLRPGERWESPVLAGLYRAADGFGGTSRAGHAYTRSHILPHPAEARPVLYNSWGAPGST